MPTKTASNAGRYESGGSRSHEAGELEKVMADTGVNREKNAGRVNVPEATEEAPSLVLTLKADAEENKGCGAQLAEMPGTEEQKSKEALPWIDEMMAGMEFPIARTTASVRESVNWGNQELEAVLVTGIPDVAVDGRESSVGKPTNKLLLVEWDGSGITKDNRKLSSRGRTTTGTARNNGNVNHFNQKKLFTEPRENATLLKPKAKPTKIGAEPRETLCY